MATSYLCAIKSRDAGGVQYVNTFGVHSSVTGPDITEAGDQAVVDGVADWLLNQYRDCLSTAYTVDAIELTGILGHDGQAEHVVNSPGTLTLFAGSPAPKECCMVVSWKTNHVGRSGRGRVFIPSPRDSTYIKDATSWKGPTELTGHEFYDAVDIFASTYLGGFDITEDLINYHLSAVLYSRVDATTRDLKAYQIRLPVHWLRSRSTAP